MHSIFAVRCVCRTRAVFLFILLYKIPKLRQRAPLLRRHAKAGIPFCIQPLPFARVQLPPCALSALLPPYSTAHTRLQSHPQYVCPAHAARTRERADGLQRYSLRFLRERVPFGFPYSTGSRRPGTPRNHAGHALTQCVRARGATVNRLRVCGRIVSS